jgi:AraC family transcriptional regulator, positive regulator of tynA and feaB
MHSSARDGHGFEASNEALRDICGAYQVMCDRWWVFRGDIRTQRIGSLDLAAVSVSACSVIRDHRDEYYRGDQYFLIFQADGCARMCQRGSEALLRPGDCTLIDSRYPSVFDAPQGFKQYSFHLPAHLFNERFGKRTVPLAQTIRGDSGAGGLLSDMLKSFLRNAESLHGVELTSVTLQLLTTALGMYAGARSHGCAPEMERRNVNAREVEHYIDAHIGQQDLSPESIARHFNISVRQLYRVVATVGSTPAALIWSSRLKHAHLVLAQGSPRVPIIDVALSCGFKDGAHFSRAYRKAFGHPPTLSRRLDAAPAASVLPPRESAVAQPA